MEYGTEMLRRGKAYIDDTPVEQMRKERGEGIESRRRNASLEENMKLWEEMKKGTESVSVFILFHSFYFILFILFYFIHFMIFK